MAVGPVVALTALLSEAKRAPQRAPARRVLPQPILSAMLRAACVKATDAFVAPAPFVDLTQALPRSVQTLFIWGMFGIGTPPVLALPNWARYGSLTFFPAWTFAG